MQTTTETILATTLVLALLAAAAPAQKHPVQGDPKRTIQVFDVQDFVRPETTAAAAPAEAPADPNGKRIAAGGAPLLDEIPILGHMFRRKPRSDPPPADFTADKLALDGLQRLVRGFVEPRLDDGEEVKTLGKGNLMALATADKLAWIERFLRRNRELADARIEIDARFLIVPQDVFERQVKPRLEAVGRVGSREKDAEQKGITLSGPLFSARMPRQLINKYALLADAKEREQFLVQVVREKGVELLTTPRISTPTLTRAHVLLGNRTAYVKDFNVEVTTTGVIADPVVDTVTDGLALECTVAHLQDGVIGMDLQFSFAKLARPIKEVTTHLVKGGNPITIQLPELSISEFETRVELTGEQTALFALPTPDAGFVLALVRTVVKPAKDGK